MKKLSKRHELVVNMPYVLLHFLIQENVLELFCNNVLYEFLSRNIKLSIKEKVYKKSYTKLIIDNFFYAQTPEGHDFWYHIDKKYQMYLSTLSNN